MTEQEWLDCADPEAILKFLRGKLSDRKLRLFACACVRELGPLVADRASKAALQVAERHADGRATEAKWYDARVAAWAASGAILQKVISPSSGWKARAAAQMVRAMVEESPTKAAHAAVRAVAESWYSEAAWCDATRRAFADSLRDLVGNPFRAVEAPQPWLNPAVSTTAQAVYEGRHFDELPVVADALEEAGCTDEALLGHLRSPGPHVRGCWALDLILSKE
jgi:hypothetical protein